MDNTKTVNILSLCTGYGGMELAIDRIITSPIRVVAVEIETYAIANLVSKAEEGKLAIEALHTDVKTFPSRKFRGCFDIITAGYPCQPFSHAGKRLGSKDPRHLWPFIRRHIANIRPVCVILENVAGHVTMGFREVCQDLWALGYKVEAGLFTAAEVGAPHKRERLFIVAYSGGQRWGGWDNAVHGGQDRALQAERPSTLANSFEQGLEGDLSEFSQERWEAAWGLAARCGEVDGEWVKVIFGNQCEQISDEEWYCPRCGSEYADCPCPGPTEEGLEYKENNDGIWCRLQSKWPARPGQEQYGWEQPRTIESGVGKSTYGPSSRVDQLRLLGNGIVPDCAEKAIRYLFDKVNYETQTNTQTN